MVERARVDDLTLVVQAGGESRRMGRSKATVPFLGEPLIMRVIRRVSPYVGETIITTNEPENLTFLSSDYGRDDIRLVRDVLNQRGALGGLLTALSEANNPSVAIIACDMIFASAPLMLREYEIMNEGGFDLVVPKQTHGYEPFHAVYRRDPCLAAVQKALERGDIRAYDWYDLVNVHFITRDEVLDADPRGGAFINVNTPEELKTMETRVLAGEITKLDDVAEGK